MRILIFAHFQGDGSPTANFIHAQIVEFLKLGHVVKVIVPVPMLKKDYFGKRVSKCIEEVVIDNVEHVFVRYISLSSIGEYGVNISNLKQSIRGYWRKIIANFNPDIIHAHTIGLDSEIAYYIGKQLSTPVVLTVHGTDVERLLTRPEKRIRLYCSHMDRIVAVSSVLMEKLSPYSTKERLTSILNGFSVKEKIDVTRDPLRIIQVCNLIPSKRVNVTIEAFYRVHSCFSGAKLIIIGDGPERLKLEEKCKNLGLADCVSFKGQLDNKTVLDEMAKSAYFVMASAPEGFGIVYLEAMSMGCLTIGSKGEGISDLIVNNQNGCLVDVDDAEGIAKVIVHLFKNPEMREQIASRGNKDVRTLTWENNAKKYIELFQTLL